MIVASLLACVLAAGCPAQAEDWIHTWGGKGIETAFAIDVDDSGSVYVGVQSHGYRTGGEDVLLLKYNSAGNLQWKKTWGGNSDDTAYAIAAGGKSVYVAGGTMSYGADNYDVLLLKYDSTGNLLWTKTWGGDGSEYAHAVTVGEDGSVYLAGNTESYGAGRVDVLLLKYDSSGNLLVAKTWGGSDDDRAFAITVDDAGSVFIAGHTDSYRTGDRTSMLLLKYDSTGNLLWTKILGWEHRDFFSRHCYRQ
ncbi:hypothetical protein IIA79_03735 [bacterium]|nr:hypothetical protein [bacterium]